MVMVWIVLLCMKFCRFWLLLKLMVVILLFLFDCCSVCFMLIVVGLFVLKIFFRLGLVVSMLVVWFSVVVICDCE